MLQQTKIDELAQLPKMNISELEAMLIYLEKNGAKLLECISFVKCKQRWGLKEASMFVIASKSMDKKRDGIIKYQEEMFYKFVEYSGDNVEHLAATYTEGGDSYALRLKNKP